MNIYIKAPENKKRFIEAIWREKRTAFEFFGQKIKKKMRLWRMLQRLWRRPEAARI